MTTHNVSNSSATDFDNFSEYIFANSSAIGWHITNKSGLTAFVTWMCTLFVIGVIGNLLVVVHYPWKHVHIRGHGMFLKLLTYVDMFTCLLVIPYSIIFELSLVQNSILCKLAELTRYLLVGQSLLSLLCVAAERYMAVSYPLLSITRRHACIIVTTVIAISLLFALPVFFLYRIFIELSTARKYFVMDFATCYMETGTPRIVYGLCLLLAFVTVTITMLVLYTIMFYRIVHQFNRISPAPEAKSIINGDNCSRQTLSQKDVTNNDINCGKNIENIPSTSNNTGNIFKTRASGKSVVKVNNMCPSCYNKNHRHTRKYRRNHHSRRSRATTSHLASPSRSTTISHNPVVNQKVVFRVQQAQQYEVIQIQSQSRTTYKVIPTYPKCDLCSQVQNKSQNEGQSQENTNNSKGGKSNSALVAKRTQQRKHQLRLQMRIGIMLFFVTLVFIISWIPFWLQKLLLVPYHPHTHYMFFVNNATNIFWYLIFNKKFRNNVRTSMSMCF